MLKKSTAMAVLPCMWRYSYTPMLQYAVRVSEFPRTPAEGLAVSESITKRQHMLYILQYKYYVCKFCVLVVFNNALYILGFPPLADMNFVECRGLLQN